MAISGSVKLVSKERFAIDLWDELKTAFQTKLNQPLDPGTVRYLCLGEVQRGFTAHVQRITSTGRNSATMGYNEDLSLIDEVLQSFEYLGPSLFSISGLNISRRAILPTDSVYPNFDLIIAPNSDFLPPHMFFTEIKSPYLLGALYEPQLLVCETIQQLARDGFIFDGRVIQAGSEMTRAVDLLLRVWTTALCHNVQYVKLSDDWYTIYFRVDGTNLEVGPTLTPTTLPAAERTQPSLYQTLMAVVWKALSVKQAVIVQPRTSEWLEIIRFHQNPFNRTTEDLRFQSEKLHKKLQPKPRQIVTRSATRKKRMLDESSGSSPPSLKLRIKRPAAAKPETATPSGMSSRDDPTKEAVSFPQPQPQTDAEQFVLWPQQ